MTENLLNDSTETDLPFQLPTNMDISCAKDIYDEISRAISGNKNITLNANNVERITTPGVQLLVATADSIKAKGGVFIISWPSENFKKIISELGFLNQLKEWTGNDG